MSDYICPYEVESDPPHCFSQESLVADFSPQVTSGVCSPLRQSLVSSQEKTNQETSKYNCVNIFEGGGFFLYFLT